MNISALPLPIRLLFCSFENSWNELCFDGTGITDTLILREVSRQEEDEMEISQVVKKIGGLLNH